MHVIRQLTRARIVIWHKLTTLHLDLERICSHIHKDTFRRVIEYIKGAGPCSNSLLIAYILACRGRPKQNSQDEADPNDANQFYRVGTRLLRDRLTSSETASSDENIQAVLLLIAYASDTGSIEEVPIHTSALARMIRQRGGLEALEAEIDPALMLQLQAIPKSRALHLTMECESKCTAEQRFPQEIGILELQHAT